jgi:CheY-like chemotaxis protein
VLSELRPGLVLRTAMNGLDGSVLAEQQRPDVLLLDLNLPDLAGEEVLRRMRARPRTGDVPVIILSADSTSRNINRLLEAGADAYLTKPVNVPQFLDVLDRLLVDAAPKHLLGVTG